MENNYSKPEMKYWDAGTLKKIIAQLSSGPAATPAVYSLNITSTVWQVTDFLETGDLTISYQIPDKNYTYRIGVQFGRWPDGTATFPSTLCDLDTFQNPFLLPNFYSGKTAFRAVIRMYNGDAVVRTAYGKVIYPYPRISKTTSHVVDHGDIIMNEISMGVSALVCTVGVYLEFAAAADLTTGELVGRILLKGMPGAVSNGTAAYVAQKIFDLDGFPNLVEGQLYEYSIHWSGGTEIYTINVYSDVNKDYLIATVQRTKEYATVFDPLE